MPSVEYDLEYVRAGLAALEQYLLSNDLYWPTSARPPAGEPAYPRLTLSGLLLAQKRLQARPLNPTQQAELARLDERLDETSSRWRVAWEGKAAREFHARLNLWRDFLHDYRENPESNADRYAYEVQRRVMLELLSPDAVEAPQAERDMFRGLDQLLRAVFLPGEFVWEAELEPGFPQDAYWYLYGRLKK